MTVETPPALEDTNSTPVRCAGCSYDLPEQIGPGRRRLYCDRCRELHRIQTLLNQARIIAERLSYDSQLAARIRLAVKAAQR